MKPNRVTIDEASKMSASQLAFIPVDQAKALTDDADAIKEQAKIASDTVHRMMEAKYADAAKQARRERNADTGTVRIEDGEFVVITDLPKRVSWDEDGLQQVERQLADMGEPVEEYIKIKREVPESKYKGWPSGLQKMFAPYRTVTAGKATYKMELRKE